MNLSVRKQPLVWRKAFLTIAILGVLIFALNAGQLFIRNSFYAISRPLSDSFSNVGRLSFASVSSSVNFASVGQENSNLKQENERLLSQVAALQSQIQQNQAERLVLQATQNDPVTLAATGVIGIDLVNQLITISKGSSDGIAVNMPVINSQKAVFGKIIAVYAHTTKVQLISAKKSVVDVKILQDNLENAPINGVLKGDGNLGVYLDLVSSDAVLTEGDVLLTSGLEGTFPKDLLIGKISAVNKNDVKAFQTASVKPFFDVKNADTVFVITSYKK